MWRYGSAPLREVSPGTSEGRTLRIAIVIPPFGRGSGGHNTLFQILSRLEQRGLTLEDFSDYIARKYWRTVVEDAEPDDLDIISADDDLRDLFTIELIFADEVDRQAKQLMWRLAARAASEQIDAKAIAVENEKFCERLQINGQPSSWLQEIGRDEEWLHSW